MTTPRSVIFNKDILSFIHNNIIPIETNNLVDWLVLLIWNRFALYIRREISSLEVLKEFNNGISSNVTFQNIFIYITSRRISDPNLWKCTINPKIVGNSLSQTIFNTGIRHQYLTLELIFNFSQGIHGRGTVVTIINKNKDTRFSLTEDQLSGIFIKFHYSWHTIILQELFNCVHLKFTLEIISSFIKLLEKNNSDSLNSVLSGDICTVDVVED